MACHYFSVPAKSLVAAQMHKMVFRHVSLLCTLGAVAAAAVLRMFVQEPRKLRYAYSVMYSFWAGNREDEIGRRPDKRAEVNLM